MKFSIVNSFHRDDKGDAALVHVLIDQLLAIDPKADITISNMEDPRDYPIFYRARNIGSFELQSSSHIHSNTHLFFKVYIFFALFLVGKSNGKLAWLLSSELRKIYNEYATADLIVSVGGGYFITKHDLGSRMHLVFALQTLMLAKDIGRKVVTAPVSVGPFRNDFEASYAVPRLRLLDLLLLREDISKRYFTDKHGQLPTNIKRVPDSGFIFAPEGSYDIRKTAGAKNGDKVLIIAVRNWTKSNRLNYEQAHADLIDHIAKRYPQIKPIFIPQCTFPHVEDDDRTVGKKIVELSHSKNAVVIEEDLDYKNVKLSYRNADFVVGTRFHSMVFGLSYNVPGIAIEYEHKTRGIMRDLGLEKWVIPINSINSEHLIMLFDKLIGEQKLYKQHLSKIMPGYIMSANEVIPLFANILS